MLLCNYINVRRHRIVRTEKLAGITPTSAKGVIREERAARPKRFSGAALLEPLLRGEGLESDDGLRALVTRDGESFLGIYLQVLDRQHDSEEAFHATCLTPRGRGILPDFDGTWLVVCSWWRTESHSRRRVAPIASGPAKERP
jgi:hypothetical protein